MSKEYIEREMAIEAIKNDLPNVVNYRKADAIECLETLPASDVVKIPESGIGDLSDGYHTFNELYHHRAILFSVICNSMPDRAWKSKLHDTGDMFDGMFIVGIETPQGQATYHYDINPYWDMFKVRELEKAPKWDGHTPKDAIERISVLKADVEEIRYGKMRRDGHHLHFNCCNKVLAIIVNESDDYDDFISCPFCGAKLVRKDEK